MSQCHICHVKSVDPVLGKVIVLVVCEECGCDVCSDCADHEADLVGNPPRYVGTSVCHKCRDNCAHGVPTVRHCGQCQAEADEYARDTREDLQRRRD